MNEEGQKGGGAHRSVNTGILDCCLGACAKTLFLIETHSMKVVKGEKK